MSELRYPNESREYRDARDSLLKDEQELVDKLRSVAEKRRSLPVGGQLKGDYVFQWANDGKVGQPVKFSELFGECPRDGGTPSKERESSRRWFTSSRQAGAPAPTPSAA